MRRQPGQRAHAAQFRCPTATSTGEHRPVIRDRSRPPCDHSTHLTPYDSPEVLRTQTLPGSRKASHRRYWRFLSAPLEEANRAPHQQSCLFRVSDAHAMASRHLPSLSHFRVVHQIRVSRRLRSLNLSSRSLPACCGCLAAGSTGTWSGTTAHRPQPVARPALNTHMAIPPHHSSIVQAAGRHGGGIGRLPCGLLWIFLLLPHSR